MSVVTRFWKNIRNGIVFNTPVPLISNDHLKNIYVRLHQIEAGYTQINRGEYDQSKEANELINKLYNDKEYRIGWMKTISEEFQRRGLQIPAIKRSSFEKDRGINRAKKGKFLKKINKIGLSLRDMDRLGT